jgi:hypothetical protein
MRIDQARHEHASAQVDHAGAAADTGVDLGIAADGDDHPVPDGNGLGNAVSRVHRVDLAVYEGRVGRFPLRLKSRGAGSGRKGRQHERAHLERAERTESDWRSRLAHSVFPWAARGHANSALRTIRLTPPYGLAHPPNGG